jgi:ring-1,2-phenylacetyl-CoA epoxidase subunit PaaD
MALGRVHLGGPAGTRGGLVSAMQSVAKAGAEAGRSAARTPLEEQVWAALAEVPDPEIPAVSVVDLGVIRSVEAMPDRIMVEMLPTFVGCPAIDAMRQAIGERLAGLAEEIQVELSFAEPWTSDRISPTGRARLRQSGFGPPLPEQEGIGPRQLIPLLPAAECPYCGSRRTVLENAFGPTLCRAIHYCTDCRQPFEQFKTV